MMVGSPITQEDFTSKISPGKNACEAICVHWWDAPDAGATFDGVVQRLAYSSAQVSAHFVAEAGRVSQIAGYEQIAWHCAAGSVNKNPVWVGVECNPRCGAGDVATVAELIADIWRSVGRKTPLVKHRDAVATQCPGPDWSRLVDSGELKNLASKIYDGGNIEMASGEEVWGERLKNHWGKEYAAGDILTAIDENTANQPARVWDAPVVNRWGAAHGVRHILASMDKNIVDTLVAAKEANAKADVIVDQLKKLDGFDAAVIEAAIKDATDKIAEEAKKAMETVEITFTAKKEEGGNE